jgi:hypothetical protein
VHLLTQQQAHLQVAFADHDLSLSIALIVACIAGILDKMPQLRSFDEAKPTPGEYMHDRYVLCVVALTLHFQFSETQ